MIKIHKVILPNYHQQLGINLLFKILPILIWNIMKIWNNNFLQIPDFQKN